MQKPDPAGLRPLDGVATFVLIMCCVVWGVNQVAVKFALEGIPPFMQAGLRSLISAVLVVGWALWRKVPLFRRDGTLMAGIVVGFGFAFNFLVLYKGLALTTASHAALLVNTMPFFMAVAAHFLIPGDTLTRPKVLGLIAAFAGLLIAFGDGLISASGKGTSVLGDILCLGSAIGWAFTTLVVRTTSLRSSSAEKVLLYQLGVSMPLFFTASLLFGEGAPSFAEPLVLWSFLYTAVVVGFITYLIWFWMLGRHPASVLASFTSLMPVFGVLAGGLFLGDPLSLRILIGLAFVTFGIYLVNKSSQRSATGA
jgi:drug/metabolite transporter (DMT)-like permease